MPVSEDYSGALSQQFRAQKLKSAEDRLKALQQQSTPAYVREEETPDEPEPLENIWARTGEMGRAALADLAKGVLIEGPTQVLGGARDAIQSTMEAMDSIDSWLAQVPLSPDWIAEQLGLPTVSGAKAEVVATGEADLPEVPEATTFTGDAVRSISQFVTGFIPALKAVRGVSAGGKALTGLKGLAQTEAAAAISAALVFDPHEERLSNMIETVEGLSNPVTNYLQASPDDGEAEGRFKNALEGLGLGLVAEGVVRGVRAVKANRIEKGLEPTQPISQEVSVLGDRLGQPDGPLLLDAPQRKGLPFEMNWAKYTSSEEIEGAVTAVARMFTEQIDEARRGKMTEEGLQELSRQLGLTPEDLIQNRFKGSAYKAEEILAMRTILEDSTQKLIDLARVARDSSDPADIFAFRKMMDIHVGIQAQFQGAASESGRALRALQIPSGSRERQLMMLEGPLLQGQTPDEIRRLAAAVGEINDPARIAELARGSMGKRVKDAIVEWWYAALLSGPRTHIVNVASTALNTAWQVPERALASGFRALRGSNEGVQAGEAVELMYGFIGSIGDAFRAAGRAFATEQQANLFGKVESRVPAAITSENFPVGRAVENLIGRFSPEVGKALGQAFNKGIDGLGTVVRVPGRAIMAEDEFFRVIGKSMETRALAFRKASEEGLEGEAFASRMQELLQNPPQSFLDEAEAFANSLTFTTPLEETGRAFQQFTNQHPALKVAVPFVRTPINLLKWSASRTPLGLLSKEIRRDIAAGGAKGDLALARITMGSMAAMMATDWALRGQITGAGPSDPQLRETWLRTRQPFSIKIGDNWYSYNRMDPMGMLLGAAASYAEIAGPLEPRDREDLAGAIALATSRAVVNKTWMTGLTSALDALTAPDKYGMRFLEQTLGTFLVPTGVAQVAGQIDPAWREVNGVIDALKARVPGYSEELPARRNLWGEKILYEGGLGPNIVSPTMKFDGAPRPIDDWMFENDVTVDMPTKTQMGVELTPHQYERFVELAGNEVKDPVTGLGLYDTLNALVEGQHPRSQFWKRQTDGPEGGKALMLKSLVSAFRDLAQVRLMQEDEEFRNRVDARSVERGRALQETIMLPTAGRAPR